MVSLIIISSSCLNFQYNIEQKIETIVNIAMKHVSHKE